MKRLLILSVLTLGLTAADGRCQQWGGQPPMSGCGAGGCGAGGCGAAAPAAVVNETPCCPAGPGPGLFPRLRERLRGACSSCSSPCPPARPGLLQRIRNRIAERHAAACVAPCP
jgi:hypothetical protein